MMTLQVLSGRQLEVAAMDIEPARRCTNTQSGGTGFTSEDSKVVNTCFAAFAEFALFTSETREDTEASFSSEASVAGYAGIT